jgi:hypothetical protein
MPWVRFDDQFTIHRKVDGLSDAAFRLHTSAIFWSARNLTDGFVSREDLDGVSARVRTPDRFAAECVIRGVWHLGDEECPSEKCPAPVDGDGWVIHDYWEFQPSKVQVVRDRQAAARRQAKWRESRNPQVNPQGYPQGGTAADLHNPHIHRREGQSNARSNGVTNAVSASSPPRPERKRGGKAPPRASSARAVARSAGSDAACHPFKPDPNGTCETCGLPETNRHHLEAS